MEPKFRKPGELCKTSSYVIATMINVEVLHNPPCPVNVGSVETLQVCVVEQEPNAFQIMGERHFWITWRRKWLAPREDIEELRLLIDNTNMNNFHGGSQN